MSSHLPLDHPDAPRYWMHETSGVLRSPISAYLNDQPLSEHDIAAIRAYLRQWIMSPVWSGPDIDGLRDGIDSLTSRAQIDRWLARSIAAGIDPL